jgi:hypothetical protein
MSTMRSFVDKQKQVELLSVLEPKIRRMVGQSTSPFICIHFLFRSLTETPIHLSEIFMKGHKIDDPSEISTKILSCDEKYCTLMFLESLSKFLPTPEQVRHPLPVCIFQPLAETFSFLFCFAPRSGRKAVAAQDRHSRRAHAPPRGRSTHGPAHQDPSSACSSQGYAVSSEVRGKDRFVRGGSFR